MFKRSSSLPQRNPFSMSSKQVLEDVEMVYNDPQQREKLYQCLDDKPPQEHKFDEIEEFLLGTQDLEQVANKLEGLVTQVEVLESECKEKLQKLRETVDYALNNSM